MSYDFCLSCWIYLLVLFSVLSQSFARNRPVKSEKDVNEFVRSDASKRRKEPLHSANIDLTSLPPSLGVILTGVTVGDKLGYSVSLGGDVNVDSKADILIGAPGLGSNAGMAYMLYGGTTLTSVTLDNVLAAQGMAIEGIGPGYGTGWSVDLGGDVNGDGYADMMIGAPLYLTNTGQAYIVLGGNTLPEYVSLALLDVGVGITITGPVANAYAGHAVSLRSDMNQDGMVDPIITAYGFSTSRGKIYYFLGTSSPANVSISSIPGAQDLSGGSTGFQAGYAVASGGDANGDNKKDTLVGSPSANSNTGVAHLLYAGTLGWSGFSSLAGLTLSRGISITGAAVNCKTGSAVAIGGDVNGDTIGDFLVGAPGCNSGRGAAYLLYGGGALTNVALVSLSLLRGITITGENAGDGFGSSVSVGGDFNGDNHADIVIGAPGYSSSTGAVYLIYGSSANLGNIAVGSLTLSQGLKIIGETANSFTGFALSLQGDTSNDGKVDLLIGAYGYDSNRGRVYLIYGASGLETIYLGGPQPSGRPTSHPSGQPVSRPSSQPTKQPFPLPSSQPTNLPSDQPTSQPSSQPTGQPSSLPLSFPSSQPSVEPSNRPSSLPSLVPSGQPTQQPTDGSTAQPSAQPSTPKFFSKSIPEPTEVPSRQPSSVPTSCPSRFPSVQPTSLPSSQPSQRPSTQPTKRPTTQPSTKPSGRPSGSPSSQPSGFPSGQPSPQPSLRPSRCPTSCPSKQPSSTPSTIPSAQPTDEPSSQPSSSPSEKPSVQPTCVPTENPSSLPSSLPSSIPSSVPSLQPFGRPSSQPTNQPSGFPSTQPSGQPTMIPSSQPSAFPSSQPSSSPSSSPSTIPTSLPSGIPTDLPSVVPSSQPTNQPSGFPSGVPSGFPSTNPTAQPSESPTSQPTGVPSIAPSGEPTGSPTSFPSSVPSVAPSGQPTVLPTRHPTSLPSLMPSSSPTNYPTVQPSSQPTVLPSSEPSNQPTSVPSLQPMTLPSSQPTVQPTGKPSCQPFSRPSLSPSSVPSSQPTGRVFFRVTDEQRRFKQYLFLFGTFVINEGNLFENLNNEEGNLGKSFIIYGSTTNPMTVDVNGITNTSTSADSQELTYGQSHDSSFRSFEVVKDINGDEHDDVLLGDPLSSVVYVLYGRGGSDTLYQMGKGYQIIGETTSDYLGWSVSGAGDMNNDGINDMIIGAILANMVYIIFGVTGSSTRNNVLLSTLKPSEGIRIIGSSPLSSVGMSVSSIGDFNHDGYQDIVLSAKSTSQNFIYIIYGNHSLPAVIKLNSYKGNRTVIASGSANFAGTTMSGLGDVNGDGIDDFVIGSVPRAGLSGAQKSFVLYGQRSSIPEISLDQLTVSQGFQVVGGGMGVSGIGDINGDGLNDFMVNSFNIWQGQSASYIMLYPNPTTQSPTVSPTLSPTEVPSFVPTTANVSSAPIYSLTPSTFPSLRPTILPSISPTRRPTVMTTFAPSVGSSFPPTRVPFAKLTLAPSSSSRPLASPTRVPSFRPSTAMNSPSSVPSIYPTYSSNSFTIITDITKGGDYNGMNWTKVEIRINSPNNVLLTLPDQSVNKFKIYPQPNMTIVFNNFNSLNLLDISLFPELSQIAELSYSTDPLTILLPNNQMLVFPSMTGFELTGRNFLFTTVPPSSSSADSQSISQRNDLTWSTDFILFPIILVFLTAVVFLICRRSSKQLFAQQSKEKIKLLKTVIAVEDNPNLPKVLLTVKKPIEIRASPVRSNYSERDLESHGKKQSSKSSVSEKKRFSARKFLPSQQIISESGSKENDNDNDNRSTDDDSSSHSSYSSNDDRPLNQASNSSSSDENEDNNNDNENIQSSEGTYFRYRSSYSSFRSFQSFRSDDESRKNSRESSSRSDDGSNSSSSSDDRDSDGSESDDSDASFDSIPIDDYY
jgi:hypothetical protein